MNQLFIEKVYADLAPVPNLNPISPQHLNPFLIILLGIFVVLSLGIGIILLKKSNKL